MASSIIQVIRTVVLVLVLSTEIGSQLSRGPSAIFNEFINDNSIVSTTGQPSSALSVNAVDTLSSLPGRNEDRLYRMRQRSRNHRLQSLRLQILRRLGMEHPPTVSITPEVRHRVMESLDRFPAFSHTADPLSQVDRRCYSASCGVPHKVNETLWRNSSNPGLRLFVPVPRDRTNGATLQSATLHLFLKPNAVRQVQCDCEGEEGDADHRPCRTINGFLVQVHQYVRPLSIRRRGRVVNRRRLLDAKFVPVTGNTWLTFNIRNVASDWRRHRRNFGVEVTVKDDNDTEIDAKTMFVLPDCTVGREIGCREGSSSESTQALPMFNTYRDNFPYLDLVALRTSPSPSRSKRSPLRHSPRHPNKASSRTSGLSNTLVSSPWQGCGGQRVVVNITDEAVEEPRSFLSHVCPSRCWDCKAGRQCTPRPCAAPRREPVVGRYRLKDGTAEQRVLPYSRVVACGC